MATSLPYGPAHGFGLYIHWPYCTRICPYCDFNVYAAKDRDNTALVQALSEDLARHAQALGGHPKLGSVYFGGGTPSLMAASDIARLIAQAEALFGLEADAEITLEANPNDVLANDVAGWAAAGINRLSVGIQSLEDETLRFLGRDHGADGARRAVAVAGRHITNLSIDLIYARPGQTATAWARELDDALALGAPHLSLYELTIEERTAFGKRAERGELIPMPDEEQADLYELTWQLTETRGLPAYEISNHARTCAAQSRHNLTYWRGGDWIGLGPGAHGRLTLEGQRVATLAPLRPEAYTAAVSEAAEISGEHLSPLDTARELLALGLRPVEGFEMERVGAVSGTPLDSAKLELLLREGLLKRDRTRLALTPQGRLLADRIAAELAP